MDNRSRRSLLLRFAAKTLYLVPAVPGSSTSAADSDQPWVRVHRRRLRRAAVALVVLVGAAALPSQAQTGSTTSTTSQTPSTLSAEDRAKKAQAAGNLNAAKAADSEIAAALGSINEAAQTTQSKIDQAQRRLKVARETMATATTELAESNDEQIEIEDQLRAKAVEGFKTGLDDPGPFFSKRDINQSIRQAVLLEQTNKTTAELLEDLRALLEDRQVDQAEAIQAAQDAEALEAQLVAELETLREQSTVQLRLKGEAESRIAKWEAELTAYAAEDSAIQKLIADTAATPVAVPAPAEPSLLGYQWPVVGRISSPFGYRIHPVYGTRKLHSGLDVAAPGGTPVTAASGGVVISSGWRGGYGNTVIIDHGAGISSLYGHLSQLIVPVGAIVDRGDIVGLVGATGTATGNHLHFEIRLGGVATDPRPYLP
ncbi:MAG: peptidoglycan DD-metalloendopeptidase family protein [Actinomycetia bacterium]|nr:peptidoglycan DD-metalloendopeptidase family protein [Actinomycetes bacterium]MCP4225075.1 peptidoglycan DD-metalloendopeptidase family protein [Actinomycetes bacterium]MCP5031721.1 peptidoglycan DD-metalloendopeptidase family protein [Actinomycetes bacterium]